MRVTERVSRFGATKTFLGYRFFSHSHRFPRFCLPSHFLGPSEIESRALRACIFYDTLLGDFAEERVSFSGIRWDAGHDFWHLPHFFPKVEKGLATCSLFQRLSLHDQAHRSSFGNFVHKHSSTQSSQPLQTIRQELVKSVVWNMLNLFWANDVTDDQNKKPDFYCSQGYRHVTFE